MEQKKDQEITEKLNEIQRLEGIIEVPYFSVYFIFLTILTNIIITFERNRTSRWRMQRSRCRISA